MLSESIEEYEAAWVFDTEEDAVDDTVEDDDNGVEELSLDLFISDGSIPNIDKKGTDFLCEDNKETGESLLFKFSDDGLRFIFVASVEETCDCGGVGDTAA